MIMCGSESSENLHGDECDASGFAGRTLVTNLRRRGTTLLITGSDGWKDLSNRVAATKGQ